MEIHGRSRMGRLAAVVACGATAGIVLAACGHGEASVSSQTTYQVHEHHRTGPSSTPAESGSTSTSTPPTSAPSTSVPSHAGSGVLAAGYYTDGLPGSPRYLVTIVPSASGTLSGSLKFLYQDGTSAYIFSFSGSPSVSDPSAPFALSTSPSTPDVTAEVTSTGLTLPGCQHYLRFATTSSDCVFATAGQAQAGTTGSS